MWNCGIRNIPVYETTLSHYSVNKYWVPIWLNSEGSQVHGPILPQKLFFGGPDITQALHFFKLIKKNLKNPIFFLKWPKFNEFFIYRGGRVLILFRDLGTVSEGHLGIVYQKKEMFTPV